LAVDLAEHFGGVVINADSMQLYRELELLSARPGPETLKRAPHRLYGTLAADDPCSAGRWRKLAVAEIEDAEAHDKLPIVVGGTGLYLKALIEGIAPVPTIDAQLRNRLRRALDEDGAAALHARLARQDVDGAAAIRKSDPQRILRALEVLEQTGQPLRAWQARQASQSPPTLQFAQILVLPELEAVYAACETRFDRMLAAGAANEAKRIAALGLDPALPAMKAVGLAPLVAMHAGEIDAAEASRLAKRDTRRYARRQMTWFRHQMKPNLIIKAQYSESHQIEFFSFISKFVLTQPG